MLIYCYYQIYYEGNDMKNKRKFILIVFLLLAVIIIGVSGYMILLDVTFIDAFYMTAITISTVGFGEVAEMNEGAKIFTILIIFAGLGVVGYGITSLFSLFFEGNFKDAWRRKRMESKISELENHYIVCGAGEVGRTVIDRLIKYGADFVVIEENEKQAEELEKAGVLTITGDATHEDTLHKAGVTRAKGIVSSLPTDSENVFTVLTARQLNSSIYIVSKAVEQSAHGKLKKAGADKTISPNEIGGQRIAALLTRPWVMSFLDVITRAGDVVLDLEEVTVPPNSCLTGKKLLEAKIPEQTGLIILALNRKGKENFIFNPSSGEVLHEGDTMIVLGTKEQVEKLSAIVGG